MNPFDRLLPPQETEKTSGRHLPFWKDVLQRLRQNRPAIAGLYFLIALFFCSWLGPKISGYTYYENHLEQKNQPPSATFWFGSDELGRDIFTRIWYGGRISLFVGISAALIDLVVGVVYGGIAAYFGGKTDEILMRIADILFSLPYLIVVILLMCILGSGLLPIICALTIIGWITMARIVRAETLRLKEQDYVLAAKVLGASPQRILFRHIIPNAFGPILVTMTLTIPSAIFAEAFLSFLGLGVQIPMASWGTMANDGLPAMKYYPWRLFFPALFISSTMLSLNLLGDGLRDALDPRLKK